MRAEHYRSRAALRRPRALFASAVVGGVLALTSAPAAHAADTFKPKPHPDATSTTVKPRHGHGHGHGAGTPTPGHKPPAKKGSTTFAPHTATSPSAASHTVDPAPTRPDPAAAPSAATPAPVATTSAPAVKGAGSTWTRNDDRPRADRGVVRAFATDLKSAGRSAGFPALLVGVMIVFLLVQHRLDKRDVKLSHADWVSDQGLEFSAPSTIRR